MIEIEDRVESLGELRVMGSRTALQAVLRDVPNLKITGGDTKITWDADNEDEVANARELFDRLTGKGFTAYARPKGEKAGEKITSFDPFGQRIVFVPPMMGG